MTTSAKGLAGLRKWRFAIFLIGVVAAAVLWWLFRPERLFVNQRVSEAAPVAILAAQPLFTGSVRPVGDGQARGRVNVLRQGSGLQLEIANLEMSAAGPFTVLIAGGDGSAPKAVGEAKQVGVAKPGVERQGLAVPTGEDFDKDKTVLFVDGSQRVVAKAVLEAF